jgi:hypothetical protein
MAAKTTPRHQVARLMLITRPRKRAGQVSATSIDPSDHSPFSAKFTTERPATNTAKVGASATTGQQRKQRNIDRQQGAAPVAIGQPRPEVQSDDADEQRDL